MGTLHGGVELGEFLEDDGSGNDAASVERKPWFAEAAEERGVFVVILAAGKGSRFKSSVPKVIHPCDGIPMAAHSLLAAKAAELPSVLVIGHEKERVRQSLEPWCDRSVFGVDAHRIGTAHAVYLASGAVSGSFAGDVLVLCGDNPGISVDIVRDFLAFHRKKRKERGEHYAASILTGSRAQVTSSKGSSGYGRIIRNQGSDVIDIVEKKQIDRMEHGSSLQFSDNLHLAKEDLDAVDEFNSGIVVAKATTYFRILRSVRAVQTSRCATGPDAKFEFYATDFVKLMVAEGLVVSAWQAPADRTWRLEGANTLEELKALEARMQSLNVRR